MEDSRQVKRTIAQVAVHTTERRNKMTEGTVIRIAEAVERIARSVETIAVLGILAIFFVAGIYIAIVLGMLKR